MFPRSVSKPPSDKLAILGSFPSFIRMRVIPKFSYNESEGVSFVSFSLSYTRNVIRGRSASCSDYQPLYELFSMTKKKPGGGLRVEIYDFSLFDMYDSSSAA